MQFTRNDWKNRCMFNRTPQTSQELHAKTVYRGDLGIAWILFHPRMISRSSIHYLQGFIFSPWSRSEERRTTLTFQPSHFWTGCQWGRDLGGPRWQIHWQGVESDNDNVGGIGINASDWIEEWIVMVAWTLEAKKASRAELALSSTRLHFHLYNSQPVQQSASAIGSPSLICKRPEI